MHARLLVDQYWHRYQLLPVPPRSESFACSAEPIVHARLAQPTLCVLSRSLDWRHGRLEQHPDRVCKLLKVMGRASLRSLKLAGNALCKQATIALTHWIMHPECLLQDLDLSRNPLGDGGGHQILKGLRSNGSLTALHLDECMLTNAITRKLIKLARANKSIRKLTLSWNGIEAQGVLDLLEVVVSEADVTWTSLDVSSNSFGLYVDGASPEQAALLMEWKHSARTRKNLCVQLGHIYGLDTV